MTSDCHNCQFLFMVIETKQNKGEGAVKGRRENSKPLDLVIVTKRKESVSLELGLGLQQLKWAFILHVHLKGQ